MKHIGIVNRGFERGQAFYERKQEFNALVSWLHSLRYKNIIGVFEELARSCNNRKIEVFEIGCAHAKLFSILNDKFNINYTGVEIREAFVNAANERFKKYSNFRIIQGGAEEQLKQCHDVDIIVALETLEHIPEHLVVRIVEEVSRIRPKIFVCSVPVEIGPAIWFKNLGSLLMGYMRHTEYTWPETFWAGFARLDKLPPHDTGHKGFDWRWLAQTIRHNLTIRELRTLPFSILPVGLSTSVFIISESRQQ